MHRRTIRGAEGRKRVGRPRIFPHRCFSHTPLQPSRTIARLDNTLANQKGNERRRCRSRFLPLTAAEQPQHPWRVHEARPWIELCAVARCRKKNWNEYPRSVFPRRHLAGPPVSTTVTLRTKRWPDPRGPALSTRALEVIGAVVAECGTGVVPPRWPHERSVCPARRTQRACPTPIPGCLQPCTNGGNDDPSKPDHYCRCVCRGAWCLACIVWWRGSVSTPQAQNSNGRVQVSTR
jgi:hypothetical protein